MNVPVLGEADLAHLRQAFPDLDFSDKERREVLLFGGRVDVQAAPGSGKTSLLAAKLYLLGRVWPHARRGVCVISHTNVAREEIQRRLALTPEGSSLLGYPHFIGTIHAFVNQFLALPNLRSMGVIVDVIDNDVFARKAMYRARHSGAWPWLKRQRNAESIVHNLRFAGAALDIRSSGGDLPGENTDTFRALEKIKGDLAKEGFFRHEDMFAFARQLLKASPWICDRLSHRFPLVMLDEMQDTSVDQEQLLDGCFNDNAIIQRFGDVNQSIFSSSGAAQGRTFPRAPILSLRTSKRFGPDIAQCVSASQILGEPVIGEGPREVPARTLMLYEPEAATQVIKQFGEIVLEAFTDAELKNGRVMAVCARKEGTAAQPHGRYISDYWPDYAFEDRAGREGAWQLLQDESVAKFAKGTLTSRADKIRRLMLLALKQASVPALGSVREPRALFRTLWDGGFDTSELALVCRHLVLSRGLAADKKVFVSVAGLIFDAVKAFLPQGVTKDDFAGLAVFEVPEDTERPAAGHPRECSVNLGGRSVVVGVDTVAMTKGETHLATLVLESLGHPSKKFDLAEALPRIAASTLPIMPTNSGLQEQFRNLYVAMSRPTHLLCLAANVGRVKKGTVDQLRAMGWDIVHLT